MPTPAIMRPEYTGPLTMQTPVWCMAERQAQWATLTLASQRVEADVTPTTQKPATGWGMQITTFTPTTTATPTDTTRPRALSNTLATVGRTPRTPTPMP